jgi:dUTP pyrophosphatase
MIPVKVLNQSPYVFPGYATPGSAGFDIRVSETVVIDPEGCILAPTGLRLIIPFGYEGQLRLRSSMSKTGLVMPNAPGTIDSDYRGEIMIPLRNTLKEDSIAIKAGDRVAQIVIQKAPQAYFEFLEKSEFDSYCPTARGDGGFGSTGQNSDGASL